MYGLSDRVYDIIVMKDNNDVERVKILESIFDSETD